MPGLPVTFLWEIEKKMAGSVVEMINSMEQRWSQRRPVVLEVDVWHHGDVLGSCRTRDVGLGGVFLELSEGKPQKHMDVDLVFRLRGAEQYTKHRLRARVVRVNDDGVGLMFRDFDTSSFRALQEILRQTPVAAAH